MSRHIIKRIDFLGRNVPILLQNKNGPCPLLAIANVLLLRGHIEIPNTFTEVSIEQVVQLIATRIFDANPTVATNADLRKNIDDVISIMPSLHNGLDLNVKFRHTKDYEFTREIATFDILGISLVHGWVCNPDDSELVSVLGAKSYNELVEKIINYQSAEQEYLNSKRKKEDTDERKANVEEAAVSTNLSDSDMAENPMVKEEEGPNTRINGETYIEDDKNDKKEGLATSCAAGTLPDSSSVLQKTSVEDTLQKARIDAGASDTAGATKDDNLNKNPRNREKNAEEKEEEEDPNLRKALKCPESRSCSKVLNATTQQ